MSDHAAPRPRAALASRKTDEQRAVEWADYSRSELQMELMFHTTTQGGPSGWTPDATQHLKEGFNRRLLMIESGYRSIREIGEQEGGNPLSPYEATDLAIQINAFYLNVVGALDNLAWALQSEYQLLPNTTAYAGMRQKVGLFTPTMLKAMQRALPTLEALLQQHLAWNNELRELRDPATHRIPIYAVPGVLDLHTKEERERLEREADAHFQARRFDEAFASRIAAASVGSYEPLMSLPTATGYQFRPMVHQATTDYDRLLAVGKDVLVVGFGLAPRRGF